MTSTQKPLWLGIILTGIIVLSTMIIDSAPNTAKIIPPRTTLTQANSFITNVHYYQFNDEGKLKSTLVSAKVMHYDKKNLTQYQAPHLLVYTDERIPWYISAKQANSTGYPDSQQTIHLKNHVKLYQPPVANQPATTILTSALTIYADKAIAENQQLTTLRQANVFAKGVGVKADLKQGTITLLSQSQGIIAPTKRNKS